MIEDVVLTRLERLHSVCMQIELDELSCRRNVQSMGHFRRQLVTVNWNDRDSVASSFVLSRSTETASEVNGVTREVARLRRRTAVLSHQFFLIGFLLEVHTKVYPIVMCLRVLWGYGPTNEARKADQINLSASRKAFKSNK